MSTLGNFVMLQEGQPKRLKFSELKFDTRPITDPDTKLQKQVRALVGMVVQEDGQPVSKLFSTLSEKLARALSAYIGRPDLAQLTFTITRTGKGYLTEYSLQVQ